MPICPKCQQESSELLAPCPEAHESYCIEEDEYYAHRSDAFLGRKIAGRYIVQSVLGRGSMARVYEAHQGQVDRSVALKIFRPETILGRRRGTDTTDDERERAKQQFVREAKVLGKLTHPNCVTVYDFGAEDGGSFLYIAMEFVAGSSLRTAINRGPKLDAIVEIARQLLEALREAHSLGIVHRDLKPENVVLTYRSSRDEHVAKVLDFGIAKLLAETTHYGGDSQLFGTPAYMSPEQCRGDEEAVSPASDVYAFGCILYEMICGRLPYPADGPSEMVDAHQQREIPDLEPRPGLEVPESFERLVHRTLRKDPEQRHRTGGACLGALEEAVRQSELPLEAELDVAANPSRIERGEGRQRKVSVPDDRIAGADLDPVAGEKGEGETTDAPEPPPPEHRSLERQTTGETDLYSSPGSPSTRPESGRPDTKKTIQLEQPEPSRQTFSREELSTRPGATEESVSERDVDVRVVAAIGTVFVVGLSVVTMFYLIFTSA